MWEVSVTDKERAALEAELEVYKKFEARVRRSYNSVDIEIALNSLRVELENLCRQ